MCYTRHVCDLPTQPLWDKPYEENFILALERPKMSLGFHVHKIGVLFYNYVDTNLSYNRTNENEETSHHNLLQNWFSQ
jgi:hypothetical protein